MTQQIPLSNAYNDMPQFLAPPTRLAPLGRHSTKDRAGVGPLLSFVALRSSAHRALELLRSSHYFSLARMGDNRKEELKCWAV